MGCMVYKRYFMNIISIIFITLIPPRCNDYAPKRTIIPAQNFYFIFLFFCFVSSCCVKMVALITILIRLYFNMYVYYSFPVYEIFYTTYYIYLI